MTESKNLKEKHHKYFKELHLESQEKNYFKATQDFGYNKVYRFDMLLFTYYTLDKLLKEISKRVGFSVKELRFTSPKEITGLLQGKKSMSKVEVGARQKFCLTVIKGRGILHLTGKKAKDYLKKYVKEEEVKEDITTIHGTTAYLGRVAGKVKIVNSVKEIAKVKKGDVLVSIQTNPDLLPAMKRAVAFVTDVGGITSHAAIVARELKKPCVIGTKIASKVLKDGDLVDVDGVKGDVVIIKRK